MIYDCKTSDYTSDSHNTRLGGVKPELQDLETDVNSSLADFKVSTDTKFGVTSNRLNATEENFQRHVNHIFIKELNESVIHEYQGLYD